MSERSPKMIWRDAPLRPTKVGVTITPSPRARPALLTTSIISGSHTVGSELISVRANLRFFSARMEFGVPCTT
jgi:hypothetical protein